MKILRNTAICFTTKRAQLLLCHKLVKDNKKDCMDAVHQHKFRRNFIKLIDLRPLFNYIENIETSQLICSANQLIGFNIMRSSLPCLSEETIYFKNK